MKTQSNLTHGFNSCLFNTVCKNIIVIVFGLFITQYGGACGTGGYNCATDGPSSGRNSKPSQSSSSSNSNSSDRAQRNQQAIGALQSALGVWVANKEREEAENTRRSEALNEQLKAEEARREQGRIEFNSHVSQLSNDKKLNPWGDASGKTGEKGKLNSAECIERYFPKSSKAEFSLKNTCDYPVNIKYMFSSSKPFSGSYSTLQPNQQTAETAKKQESFRYFVCAFPAVPQSLDGGCV